MIADAEPDLLDIPQLRQALHASRALLAEQSAQLRFKQALIDKLTHENAYLKRLRWAASSEAYTAEQRRLFEETLEADQAAVQAELGQIEPGKKGATDKRQPKREMLPAELPRRDVCHEPADTNCGCGTPMKRIGQDVAEKLDYEPGVFSVERHIRGKWACACCSTLVQTPVPAHVIDKGLPTAGLLAHVLVAKYMDHLPLYRQEAVFERAGHAIARSTLAQWVGQCGVQLQPLVDALITEMLAQSVLHADETPVAMLKPGSGKAHRAYVWTYATTQFAPIKAVIFDFAPTRGGQHVRDFLGLQGDAGGWRGTLVVDDYSGYKACFDKGVIEAGCMAHARRKFHELWVNHGSAIGQRALQFLQRLYRAESEARLLDEAARLRWRQRKSRRYARMLHRWMVQQRTLVPDGSATAKALDYSLRRWAALTRFLTDPAVPIDNNWVENQIRPIAVGRSNWLFAGSLRAGKRAAAVMSLIHSARLNGLNPHAYLKDVLERLPTQRASRIDELLPHRWAPAAH